jgi:hypothetical protein
LKPDAKPSAQPPERNTALGVVKLVAIHSVPPLRRRAYEYLTPGDGRIDADTPTIAEATGWPRQLRGPGRRFGWPRSAIRTCRTNARTTVGRSESAQGAPKQGQAHRGGGHDAPPRQNQSINVAVTGINRTAALRIILRAVTQEAQTMREIPEDVLAAIKSIVNWSRGCEDLVDEILENDAPVLDRWLVENGLLPENSYEMPEEVQS